jgi:DNA-binding transcriptional ArsR family regulator
MVLKYDNLSEHLQNIEKMLLTLNWKLNRLLAIHANPELRVDTDLLEFPKHLQETLLAMKKLGEASASDVATVTGKARAVESAHLNQLQRLGKLCKVRKGRKAFFSLRACK